MVFAGGAASHEKFGRRYANLVENGEFVENFSAFHDAAKEAVLLWAGRGGKQGGHGNLYSPNLFNLKLVFYRNKSDFDARKDCLGQISMNGTFCSLDEANFKAFYLQ